MDYSLKYTVSITDTGEFTLWQAAWKYIIYILYIYIIINIYIIFRVKTVNNQLSANALSS